jgi:hypothetical protein
LSSGTKNIGIDFSHCEMSSSEDPTRKKGIINETGKKSKEIDPEDLQQIRENVKSNEEERTSESQ